MLEIEVRNNDIEFALKLFRKKMVESGIERELKHRRYFISKSEARREKIRRSIRRVRKRESTIEQRLMRWTG